MSEAEVDVKILPLTDTTVETKQITVTFKMFCPEEKKIVHMQQDRIEKYLTSIWNDITYITRGRKIVTVKARFRMAEKACELSLRLLKMKWCFCCPIWGGACSALR